MGAALAVAIPVALAALFATLALYFGVSAYYERRFGSVRRAPAPARRKALGAVVFLVAVSAFAGVPDGLPRGAVALAVLGAAVLVARWPERRFQAHHVVLGALLLAAAFLPAAAVGAVPAGAERGLDAFLVWVGPGCTTWSGASATTCCWCAPSRMCLRRSAMAAERRPFEEMAGLDRLVHELARLAIMTVLSAAGGADFLFLQRLTGLTKGNLSAHLSKLEKAGLVRITERFVGETPNTEVGLTGEGRSAIEEHWSRLERLRDGALWWRPEGG